MRVIPKHENIEGRASALKGSREVAEGPVTELISPSGDRLQEAAASVARSMTNDTFPKLLLRNAAQRGSRVAMRWKDLGIWQTWTWIQMQDEIEATAIGLQSLGLTRGERIAVIGENRPRLYWTFCAAQSLGAVPVPLYPDASAEEMSYVLAHAEVQMAVVADQEQVDKVLSIKEQLPSLAQVIYDRPGGLRNYSMPFLHSFATVQDQGRRAIEADPDKQQQWLKEIAEGQAGDLSAIIYTPGTTGRPKGVMLSFHNLIVTAQHVGKFDRITADEEVVSYLPMAGAADHFFSYAAAYLIGYCISCPESRESFLEDLGEIGPTFFFAPPWILESLRTQFAIRIADAGSLRRKMYDYFVSLAERVGEDILGGRSVSWIQRALYAIGRILVYRPLLNVLGFTRIRVAYTGDEAIGPEIFRFYRSLGMNLKRVYGQTEASAFVTMHSDDEVRADTVGKPVPGVEIRIADAGEVQYRSPGAFTGYYKDPGESMKTKLNGGWVSTGDSGFLDENGHLKIIGRAKDVGQMVDGTLFAPKYIENKLKFFPEIKEAVAYGHARDFVTCMLNIDPEAVGDWADRNQIDYGSYQELSAHPSIHEILAKHVDQVNRALATEPLMAGVQVGRFLVLFKELDADDGELTRTQKLRRWLISERYAPLVHSLYNGSKETDFSTEVKFEGGLTGVISGHTKIHDALTSHQLKRQM